jgi:protein-S-isoprenylcysteine O-methyltransferase Ste14
MKPVPFTLPYALIFWSVFFWAFAPEFGIMQKARSRVREAGSRDAGSLRVILIGMVIAMVVAFAGAWEEFLSLPSSLRFPAFALGLLCLITGSLLRRHCWRMLGACFTGDVNAQADQPVVDRGAYRWVRHPSYTAGTIMFIGIGLALGSWGSALVLGIASIVTYHYRMNIEEQVLLQTLGDRYRAYMQTRKRLIPFVY